LLSARKILTVNDDQQLWGFEMTPARQEALEIKVETVSDPLDALEIIRSRPGEYSMVLADMRMRSMNGLQLAKAAKNADPRLKVTLLTLHAMDNDAGGLLASLGVDAFVAKPVSHASLEELLSLLPGARDLLPAQ
jgi:CheY-like chemotaxis protein